MNSKALKDQLDLTTVLGGAYEVQYLDKSEDLIELNRNANDMLAEFDQQFETTNDDDFRTVYW